MDNEKKQDKQELNEEELTKVNGAGYPEDGFAISGGVQIGSDVSDNTSTPSSKGNGYQCACGYYNPIKITAKKLCTAADGSTYYKSGLLCTMCGNIGDA